MNKKSKERIWIIAGCILFTIIGTYIFLNFNYNVSKRLEAKNITVEKCSALSHARIYFHYNNKEYSLRISREKCNEQYSAGKEIVVYYDALNDEFFLVNKYHRKDIWIVLCCYLLAVALGYFVYFKGEIFISFLQRIRLIEKQ